MLLTLGLLFYVDRGSFTQLQDLAQRLSKTDLDRQQAMIAQRGLESLDPLAIQITQRRDDLMEGVQQLAADPAVRSLYATGHAAKAVSQAGAKAENLGAALKRLAASKQGLWESAEMEDKAGKVIASWPEEKGLGRDASKDGLYTLLASPGAILDQPVFDFVRKEEVPSSGKGPKAAAAPAQSFMVVDCGIEAADGNLAGLVSVKIPAEKLLGLKVEDFLKPVKSLSPKSSLILMRGTGDQVFHSSKGPYAENFDRIGTQEFKGAMASMQAQAEGYQWISSYDGKPGLLAWRRVGSWQSSFGPSALLTLAALLPEEDFKSMQSTAVERPAPFWGRPMALLLLLLAFGLPLALALVLLKKNTDPLRRLVEVASQIDEYGAAPEGLEFREELDEEISRVNQGLNALISRWRSSEGRVHELDGALRRVEDQAGRDATQAAQELSELRSKLAGAETEKAAANSKFDAAQKARADLDSQLANLKSALDTAQRSIDLKNSENKNLSAQVQDLMRTLEEQRKVAQQVQENAVRREDELVRLSAVNTLSSELKATLTVIKNYISTMLGSVGAISDTQQEFLGVVINKSARLERLIADLVELSEIGSGIKAPRMESLTLSSLVQEALLNARPQADQKKISLEFAESGTVPPVQVDKEKLGVLVRALLNQAIKVTSRGERVSILLTGRDNNSELRISDPGMSLPPDRAAKVFNQFHGVDSQAGPEFIGTGLRFPIMRAVVEAHGGKIWIESQVGRGKTFVISLPKAGSFNPQAAAPGMPPKPPMPASAGSAVPAAPVPAPSAPSLPKPMAADASSFFGEMPVAGPKPLAPPPPSMGLPSPPPGLPALPGLPPLGAPKPPAPPAGLPSLGPPPAPGAIPAPPPPGAPIAFKTEAAKGPLKEEDKAGFDAIFGTPAPPPPGAKLPSVELKTEAAKAPLADKDMANFASIFGDAPPKPVGPPPAPGAVPAPPRPPASGATPDFAAIFGDAPKPVGPPPAPGAIPAPPPKALPGDMANFDAIFGGAPSKPAPPPAPAAPAPAAPAAPASSGLDDLNNMFK
jgi:signal transduction histidine kinase